MILKLIEVIENATTLKMYPFYTTKIEDCIVYSLEPISDDGAKAAKRLNLRVITSDMEKAEKYRKEIIAALVPVGDTEIIIGLKSCILNGGGQLKDEGTNTIHTILYFDLILRSENK